MSDTYMDPVGRLKRCRRGQDLIEYTLLLAFVLLVAASLLSAMGVSVRAIWTVAADYLDRGEDASSHGHHGKGPPSGGSGNPGNPNPGGGGNPNPGGP